MSLIEREIKTPNGTIVFAGGDGISQEQLDRLAEETAKDINAIKEGNGRAAIPGDWAGGTRRATLRVESRTPISCTITNESNRRFTFSK